MGGGGRRKNNLFIDTCRPTVPVKTLNSFGGEK